MALVLHGSTLDISLHREPIAGALRPSSRRRELARDTRSVSSNRNLPCAGEIRLDDERRTAFSARRRRRHAPFACSEQRQSL
jgi:hypothetical protein